MATPEELAAEKAAQEAKEKAELERLEKEKKDKETPQSLEVALAELQRARDALTAANHEAAERRKKLSAFEADELKRQEAEKKRREAEMTEIELTKSQLADAETKRQELELEVQSYKLRRAIQRAVRKVKLEFASEAAEEDAFDHLVRVVTFDDKGEIVGLDEAITALQKERAYLFGTAKVTTPPNINAGGSGGNGKSVEAKIAELQQRFPRVKV